MKDAGGGGWWVGARAGEGAVPFAKIWKGRKIAAQR